MNGSPTAALPVEGAGNGGRRVGSFHWCCLGKPEASNTRSTAEVWLDGNKIVPLRKCRAGGSNVSGEVRGVGVHGNGQRKCLSLTAVITKGRLTAVGGHLQPGYIIGLRFRPSLLAD